MVGRVILIIFTYVRDGPVQLFPRATVTQTMEELRKTVGAAWKGILGKDRTPAVWEWQASVAKRNGGGFLYYGPGR